MFSLENEFLKVDISLLGAQLSSIIGKNDGTEYIWQANPEIWPYHAPNLFPIVGGCIKDQILIDGQSYPMKRHGFARTSTFKKIESSPTHAQLSLRFTDETLKSYPYLFEFQVVYHLEKNCLRIMYKVINLDDKSIYFSVGAHPAFNLPFHSNELYTDYYLEFEKEEFLPTHLLSKEGFFTGETQEVNFEANKLFLSPDLFKNDALIFKNISSKTVKIKSPKHQKEIVISYPHFNYLGLWAKYGAPFICVEPWLGCADSLQQTEFSDKEGMQKVEKGHVFETEYFIKINQ